jgi:hypothetical protein
VGRLLVLIEALANYNDTDYVVAVAGAGSEAVSGLLPKAENRAGQRGRGTMLDSE